MDTNKLRHFKAVIQTQNLREAADLLKISHPGLSKSIRSLEDELGVELITKDGRGIRITEAGLRLEKEIDTILQQVETLRKISHNENISLHKTCRIGTFEVFSTYLSPFIAEIFDEDIKLSFHEMIPGRMEQELVAGNIDLAITYIPIPHPELDHLKIATIKMGIFGKAKFENHKINELPFVIPMASVSGTPTKADGLDGWPDGKIPRLVKYSVNLMETALALVRKGLAVGYFPNFIVEKHNEVVNNKFKLIEIPMPKGIHNSQEIFLIKRKNSKEDFLMKKIGKILRSLS